MKKFIVFIIPVIFLFVCEANTLPLDRYGGHYSVVPDTSPYDLTYRFYVDPGATGVNDFEYKSMMDNIYTIWKSTQISECDRWMTVNMLLEKNIDYYITYPTGTYRSDIPFDPLSLIYFTTGAAVDLNLISTTSLNSGVAFSTIPICLEGGNFEVRIST